MPNEKQILRWDITRMKKEAVELFELEQKMKHEMLRIENEVGQKLAEIQAKEMELNRLIDTDADGYIGH